MAIFDIDGTIFRSSLLIELVETLIDMGIFDKKLRSKYLEEKELWQDRRGRYDDYIYKVVDVYVENIKGVEYGDFDRAVKVVVDRNKNRIYRFTRDLIKDLKRKKFFLLAISQSPRGIIDPFCKNLGFDKVYGRFYELGPTNRFTGKIVDEHIIANKANIVRRAVEKENLTLAGSYGVGDTEDDYSFLEMVENPICFNPNTKLLKHARRNKWKVVIERKDAIYEIKI